MPDRQFTNRAFLNRAIAKAQRLSITDPFCLALHEYINREAGVVWDSEHGLFWVNAPDKPQVAVWMMPVALAITGGDDGTV